jgi:cysteine desulfurase family protein (TIGR01976 family)
MSEDDRVAYDIDRIRSHFPALREGAAHFDGPGGSQVPDVVGEAVGRTLTSAISNRGTLTPSERRADAVVTECRAAIADLLAADPGGVVFGRSATALTYEVGRALAKRWGPGDEVVVTRLDHDSNIRPWMQAAQSTGATVRWVDFDPATGELHVDAVRAAVSERTRLVATTAASNLIGTRPDTAALSAVAHDVGALHWVDGVHATPHVGVDLPSLGADVWTCSPYKFLGPHCGVLAAAPDLLESLHPDKLLPSSDAVPERFELGTLPYELMAGTTAAVDFIAALDDPDTPLTRETRRQRIVASMAAVHAHESALLDRLEPALRALPGVTVHSNAALRTPTLLFTVAGRDATEVAQVLAARGVNAPASHFYAIEASRHLGLGDAGGVRVGLAPYTSEDDVSRLLDAVGEVAAAG